MKKCIIISVCILLISFIVCIVFAPKDNFNSNKIADDAQAKNIQNALERYLNDTDDWNLKFAETNNEISVEKMLLGLQNVISHDGKSLGPYLGIPYNGQPSISNYLPSWNKDSGGMYNGWKIILNIKEKRVKVEPCKDGNVVKFE